MTAKPDEEWKILSDEEDAENVPLWKALAQFTSDDLNEGLEINATVINREKPIFQKHYNAALVLSTVFGIFFLIFLFGLLVLIQSKFSDILFFVVLVLFAAAAAPQFLRHNYQYGLRIPDTPLDLPHATDRHFEEFLGYLQKASGPEAYYLTRFSRKRKPVNRRQFFGKLRYFLFSEHGTDRVMVMRFPAILPVLTDLYLHREDVQRIIAMSKPKRKAGPGRSFKYAYVEAAFDLRADSRLGTLDLNDEAVAIRFITNWLSEWFDSEANVTGEMPKRDQLVPHAKKIYDHMSYLASRKAP